MNNQEHFFEYAVYDLVPEKLITVPESVAAEMSQAGLAVLRRKITVDDWIRIDTWPWNSLAQKHYEGGS